MLTEKLTLMYGMLFTVNGIGIAASYWLVLRPPARLKIQDRSYEVSTLNARMPLILFNLATLYAITFVGVWLLDSHIPMDAIPWWNLVLQCALISVFDDTYFYFFHRWMHLNKTVYRVVHKTHHKAFTPVPIEYIYVHPLEWAMGAVAPVVGFLVVGLIQGHLSLWVLLGYSALRNLHELDIHSGLKTRIQRWVPGLALTEHHDLHHARPHAGNYASTYVFWDRLLGTEVKT